MSRTPPPLSQPSLRLHRGSQRLRRAAWLAMFVPMLPAAQTTQTVEVIGTSPLPGLGVDRDWLPYGSLVTSRAALDRGQATNLSDHLARQLPGLQVNDIQGSPYQGDLTYRGHRASGLLGAAQGLSVYLDGVRVNEPFGDVVNWDLLPEFALRQVTVVPGANPAFGLNTLGGAIALRTTDGLSARGLRGELGLGSHGRKRADVSHGGSTDGGWHHYLAASAFDEKGWRDHSPGRIGTLFAKVGHLAGPSGWDLSLLSARSRLVGNGLVPALGIDDDETEPDLLATRRSAVFTHPDRTRNQVTQLALNLSHAWAAGRQLQALAWVRQGRRDTVNGDLAEGDMPEADVNASLNTTATRQRAAGISVSLAGRSGAHQWQLGASAERSRVHYRQLEQEGAFDDTRGVVAGDEDAELSAEVRGHATHRGLYVTDTWRVAPGTAVTATLRFNRSRVANTLTSVDDDTGEVETRPEERFTYRSANPALGVVQQLGGGLALFANVARNARVPTVIELGCADPEEPCRLPAGLQSDPYLKQVRATSLEVGARYVPMPGQRAELTLYRNDNRDDILFSSVSTTGQLGTFRNFDRTRHQGLDLSWQGHIGALDLSASYSRLDATYQAEGVLRIGERNLEVRPGMRIAGLPKQTLRFSADWPIARGLSLGADLQAVSRRVTLGNEDGRVEDDEDDALDLSVPGYAVVNLRASWSPLPGLELMARVNNAFDRRTSSFGALAETPFDTSGTWAGPSREALFVAPGAPRSLFVGLRWHY